MINDNIHRGDDQTLNRCGRARRSPDGRTPEGIRESYRSDPSADPSTLANPHRLAPSPELQRCPRAHPAR